MVYSVNQAGEEAGMSQAHAAFRRQTRYLRYVTSQLGWGFPGLTRAPYGILLLLPELLESLGRLIGLISFGPGITGLIGKVPALVWVTLPILVLGGGSLLASLNLRLYYARRFGRILSESGESPSARSRRFWIGVSVLAFGYLAETWQAPFYPTGVLFGLYYLYSWLNSDRLRVHRGVAAGLAALLSLLPASEAVGLLRVLLGLELLLGGLCDHFLLVRSFRALSAGIHEHTVPRAC
jgi:hypothetical protein